MPRLLGVLLTITWLCLVLPGVALAAGPDQSELALFASGTAVEDLCPRSLTLRNPERCSPFSPGAREVRLNYLRARLPNPLPELPVQAIEVPEDAISSYTFAYVRPLPAPTYRHPAEAEADLPPLRTFQQGDNWVTVMGLVEYNGQKWYQINNDEYIRAENVAIARPSRFHGVVLTEQPQYPFGWINRNVSPSATPGGAALSDVSLRRYDMITIFGQEQLGDHLWYMIGPDRWVDQSFVARVDVDLPPAEVGADEKWIEIDTFEQTLAAYEGPRLVFATLISSGRPHTWTPDGLFRIWGKLPSTPMSNQDVDMGNPAWYYLENVEWTQYFNHDIALHAAYWHDSFGFTRSHGCVNLALLDAKWLYDWTTPYAAPQQDLVLSSQAGAGTWVWVHRSAPVAGVTLAQVGTAGQ